MRHACFALSRTIAFAVMTAAVPGSRGTLLAQAAQPETPVARLVAEPARVNLKVGDSLAFKVTAYDANGNVLPNAAVRVGGQRMAVYFGDGIVRGLRAGTFRATATAAAGVGGRPVTLDIPVTIAWPALTSIEVNSSVSRLYTGVTVAHTAKGAHADKSERKGLIANWRSSDPIGGASRSLRQRERAQGRQRDHHGRGRRRSRREALCGGCESGHDDRPRHHGDVHPHG